MSARILIIDDSEHLRAMLSATLQFKRYRVTDAENGHAGLQAALAGPHDLILCDIDMPVMNGLEFVRRFREQVSPQTPILMLTAEDTDLTSRALSAGATAILYKPFEPIALLKEIERHLGKHDQ